MMSLMHAMQAVETMTAAKPYNKLKGLKDRTSSILRQHVSDFQQGKLSKREFRKAAKERLTKAYKGAWKIGSGGDSISDSDLAKIQEDQWPYLESFTDDLAKDASAMDVFDRMDMYVDRLDAINYMGMAEGLDDTEEVEWILNADESCPDCIALASGGPYKVRDLPTTPGAGDTQCGPWCKCQLVQAS